jgi:hypothetical protein
VQYDGEFRATNLVRLKWVQRVLVDPLLEGLLEDDGEVCQVEIGFLVYSVGVKDRGGYQAWVMRYPTSAHC